jgi:MFS transporter, CP family, cyanate transporter
VRSQGPVDETVVVTPDSAVAAGDPLLPREVGLGAVLAVLLVAVNLRPAVAAVGPVLPEIGSDLHLGGVALAVLTAGPVFLFGLCAPVAAGLVRRYGLRRAVVLSLAAVAAGLLLRLVPSLPLLFAGTLVAAGGIAAGNVLVPALVKEEHPARVGLLMGLYTVCLSGSASLAAAVSQPLSRSLPGGWRSALAVWALPAAVAVAVWLPRARRTPRADLRPAPTRQRGAVLRQWTAWQVTGYFALQSLAFYTTLTWLATLFRDSGSSPGTAGLMVALVTVVQLGPSLVVPVLAARARSQAGLVLASFVLSVSGLLGLLLATGTAPVLWVVLLGLGQGIGFPLALSMVVLRTRRSEDTAALSAMAQSIGYAVAGLGPLGAGALHDVTGSWSWPLGVLVGLVAVQLVPGLLAARPRQLELPGR